MAVLAFSIVKHFDIIKDFSSGEIAFFIDTFLGAFFIYAAKNDPATALHPKDRLRAPNSCHVGAHTENEIPSARSSRVIKIGRRIFHAISTW